ncbi:MAG: site-2 protease family protein [Chloroflexi bacterium]|nr:site-2 protease family protein [Chloroflexota bacterium]
MSTTVIIQLIIALSTLIILHEIGHFAAARLFKVKVEEFGIGIPPRALTLFEAKGTKYTLNWLPLGGFVRLKGETEEDDAPDSLHAASPWARLAIFAAGPLMNLLAAVLIYAVIFTQLGAPDYSKVLIVDIQPDSPASQAELQIGDLIINADGSEISGVDMLHEIIYANLGESISISVQREGEIIQSSVIPRNPPPPEGAIGIAMSNPTRPITFFEALTMGGVATYQDIKLILTLPAELIRGSIDPEMARPVGFYGMGQVLEYVYTQDSPVADSPINLNVLSFFAWISMTLGVLNLLPIPALDGGRILFILPEIIFRKRISMEWQSILITISFTALIALMLYINLLDFINPVQLPQ